jgi:hypothetical protein
MQKERKNLTRQVNTGTKKCKQTLIKRFEAKELRRMARHRFEVTVTMGVSDSSVGITARYGLEGLGIESGWGRDLPHPSRPYTIPTQPSARLLPGLFTVDRAARAWHWPPNSISGFKGRVGLYLYSPSAFSWPVLRCNFSLPWPLLLKCFSVTQERWLLAGLIFFWIEVSGKFLF